MKGRCLLDRFLLGAASWWTSTGVLQGLAEQKNGDLCEKYVRGQEGAGDSRRRQD